MTVQVIIDRVAEVAKAIELLANSRVMVGIPSDRAGRPAEGNEKIGNAALGYIHEHGAPEANIPARPHLLPGIKSVQSSSTVPRFKRAAEAALEGRPESVTKQLSAAGQEAADAVRKIILGRVPPPLQPGTIVARLTRKAAYKRLKGRVARAQAREAYLASSEGFTPLIDTGKLLAAYTWVIRRLGKDVAEGAK